MSTSDFCCYFAYLVFMFIERAYRYLFPNPNKRILERKTQRKHKVKCLQSGQEAAAKNSTNEEDDDDLDHDDNDDKEEAAEGLTTTTLQPRTNSTSSSDESKIKFSMHM